MTPEQATKRILVLDVNGARREVAVPDQALLLDVLREELRLTGTKRGCDMGTCGCCAVQVDGKPRLACLTLAWQVEGKDIKTIEGLAAPDGTLHPLQKAFAECGGSQCGFCTPGFLTTGAAWLKDHPTFTDAELREAVSGNLCRCTGYLPIFDAFRAAAKEMAK